jgi:hypothetical protein
MTPAERRERGPPSFGTLAPGARAHGIMPRRPAQRPWLAEGCSRSTWYRRKAKAQAAARNQASIYRSDGGRFAYRKLRPRFLRPRSRGASSMPGKPNNPQDKSPNGAPYLCAEGFDALRSEVGLVDL